MSSGGNLQRCEQDFFSRPRLFCSRGASRPRPYGGDTQSRNLRKKLAQVSCIKFVQVHASSADDTSNKNGHSWTKQITFSTLFVDQSMGTQNFYLNNLNKFKK